MFLIRLLTLSGLEIPVRLTVGNNKRIDITSHADHDSESESESISSGAVDVLQLSFPASSISNATTFADLSIRDLKRALPLINVELAFNGAQCRDHQVIGDFSSASNSPSLPLAFVIYRSFRPAATIFPGKSFDEKKLFSGLSESKLFLSLRPALQRESYRMLERMCATRLIAAISPTGLAEFLDKFLIQECEGILQLQPDSEARIREFRLALRIRLGAAEPAIKKFPDLRDAIFMSENAVAAAVGGRDSEEEKSFQFRAADSSAASASASASAAASAQRLRLDSDKLEILRGLGFPSKDCERALILSRNNLQFASNLLSEGGSFMIEMPEISSGDRAEAVNRRLSESARQRIRDRIRQSQQPDGQGEADEFII